ncbi:hypothetical protein P7C70_g3846, partial [Phenoliferia sp. Uapishka_3]
MNKDGQSTVHPLPSRLGGGKTTDGRMVSCWCREQDDDGEEVRFMAEKDKTSDPEDPTFSCPTCQFNVKESLLTMDDFVDDDEHEAALVPMLSPSPNDSHSDVDYSHHDSPPSKSAAQTAFRLPPSKSYPTPPPHEVSSLAPSSTYDRSSLPPSTHSPQSTTEIVDPRWRIVAGFVEEYAAGENKVNGGAGTVSGPDLLARVLTGFLIGTKDPDLLRGWSERAVTSLQKSCAAAVTKLKAETAGGTEAEGLRAASGVTGDGEVSAGGGGETTGGLFRQERSAEGGRLPNQKSVTRQPASNNSESPPPTSSKSPRPTSSSARDSSKPADTRSDNRKAKGKQRESIITTSDGFPTPPCYPDPGPSGRNREAEVDTAVAWLASTVTETGGHDRVRSKPAAAAAAHNDLLPTLLQGSELLSDSPSAPAPPRSYAAATNALAESKKRSRSADITVEDSELSELSELEEEDDNQVVAGNVGQGREIRETPSDPVVKRGGRSKRASAARANRRLRINDDDDDYEDEEEEGTSKRVSVVQARKRVRIHDDEEEEEQEPEARPKYDPLPANYGKTREERDPNQVEGARKPWSLNPNLKEPIDLQDYCDGDPDKLVRCYDSYTITSCG